MDPRKGIADAPRAGEVIKVSPSVKKRRVKSFMEKFTKFHTAENNMTVLKKNKKTLDRNQVRLVYEDPRITAGKTEPGLDVV